LPERNLHSFSVKPRRAEALAAGRVGTFAFRARTPQSGLTRGLS
jgi:hypothetical protein